MRVQELEKSQRPRQKVLRDGFQSLTNLELIALILQTGIKEKPVFEVAQEVLNMTGNLSKLFDLSVDDLMSIKGIREVKALQLLSGVELAKRALKELAYTQPLICLEDAYEWFNLEYGYLKQEHFVVVFLNTASNIIKHKVMFVGTIDQAVAHPREVIKEALLCDAHSIICIHNHPSGNVNPSKDDKRITKRIQDACNDMGIGFADHIIVGRGNCFSFRQNGYLD